MPSKNKLWQVKIKDQVKKKKVKKNGSKLSQLKSIDTNTANNITTSENDESLKQLTPLLNKKKPEFNKKMAMMLSRLPKHMKLIPNSAIMSLLAHNKTFHRMSNVKLDKVQCKIELMISSIYKLKNIFQDNLQSFSSNTIADDNQTDRETENSKQAVDKSKAVPVNECNKKSDETDSSNESTESSLESISKPNESFWTFAKPYIEHVSKDDLNWLKGLVLSYNTNLGKIPPLGKHYTKVWAKKCTQNNQPSTDHTQLNKLIQQKTPNVLELVNEDNHSVNDGKVFQRIMSAFKEHSNTLEENNTKKNIVHECTEDKPQDMSNFKKQFCHEKHFKDQLFSTGLAGRSSEPEFPPSISESDIDSDEILEELIKCDTELIKLQENNQLDLTKLFEKCYIDYHKNKINNKINKVNKNILKYEKRLNILVTKLKHNEQKKNRQIEKENNRMQLLLDRRNKYLIELSEFLESGISVPRMLNDSLSSDEESISI